MNRNVDNQKHSTPSQYPRQPIFNLPGIVRVFIAICVLIHGSRQSLLTPEQNILVIFYGSFIPARYAPFNCFEFVPVTSTVTYSFLHGSFSHLLNNCLWLAVFGSPLANTIGPMRFVIFWMVCAMTAALFHYFAQPADVTPMIGASGAIAGLMGAAARFGFSTNRQIGTSRFIDRLPSLTSLVANRSVLTFLAIFLATNLLIGSGQFNGLETSIAWQAHIGGIIAGFLFIPLFLPSK